MVRIVCVSDLHTGHEVGLNPKPVDNPFSKWVKETWSTFARDYYNPDMLMLTGDTVDGSGHISKGISQVTTDINKQASWAVDILSEIIGDNTKLIAGVRGSGYHTGIRNAIDGDRLVVDLLGGEYKVEIFEFPINSDVVQISHGDTKSLVNVYTYIQREMNFAEQNAIKRKMVPAFLIRGHQHVYLRIERFGIAGVVIPCWQYLTPYISKKTANRIPDIGAFVIDVEDDVMKSYPVLYPIPEEINAQMRFYKEDLLEELAKVHPKEKKKIRSLKKWD